MSLALMQSGEGNDSFAEMLGVDSDLFNFAFTQETVQDDQVSVGNAYLANMDTPIFSLSRNPTEGSADWRYIHDILSDDAEKKSGEEEEIAGNLFSSTFSQTISIKSEKPDALQLNPTFWAAPFSIESYQMKAEPVKQRKRKYESGGFLPEKRVCNVPVVKSQQQDSIQMSSATDDECTMSFAQDVLPAVEGPAASLMRQKAFYQIPKLFGMDNALGKNSLLLPRLKMLRKMLSRCDFVIHEELYRICDSLTDKHRLVLQSLKNSQSSLSNHRQVNKQWVDELRSVVVPHQVKDHKAERLVRSAVQVLIATLTLCQESGRCWAQTKQGDISNEFAMFYQKMEKFLNQNCDFLQEKRQAVICNALPRLFVFFTELFTFLPLKGNLEVCLLVLSFLEGNGKHHQRGGANADVTYKFYRSFLEFIDEHCGCCQLTGR